MQPCKSIIVQTSVLLLFVSVIVSEAKVQYKVKCKDDSMLVELKKPTDVTHIYLDGLKFYPDPACQPHIDGNQVTILLSLDNVFQCGVTRILSQLTGIRTFYHRIVLEKEGEKSRKEFVSLKCILSPKNQNHTLTKRNVLPAGFQEPEDLEITTYYTGTAPQPQLQVGVRQGGNLVTGELNVNPGTPLQMEIFLDKESAPIYGLLVSYMQVTDTKTQEETIIFNGCSVDSYLFENFNTVDGDFLTAKFRAFKFPESTYVQFKGTVNVCLDKCKGVDCSNGQIGYGRRKREVPTMPPDPNKVFEITITSFIKVNYNKGDSLLEKEDLMKQIKSRINRKAKDEASWLKQRTVPTTKTAEQRHHNRIGSHYPVEFSSDVTKSDFAPTVQLDTGMDQSTTVSSYEGKNDVTNNENLQQNLKLDTEEIREDLLYTIIEEKHSSAVTLLTPLSTILFSILLTLIFNFQQ